MRGTRVVAAVGVMLAAGCGGGDSRYVPVSGVVTLNGKAYAGAVVTFQPEGGKGNNNPGRGSVGVTDKEGRFVLACDDGNTGAVVGTHQIKIRTQGDVVGFDPNVGSPDNAPGPEKGTKTDPIPIEWRELGKNKFEVPPGGTKDANFEITNPRVK